MATSDEKTELILETTHLLTKVEFRGGLLREFQPKVQLVVEEFDDDMRTTEIQLVYKDGSVGHPANWGGMGHTISESLESNLWCLGFELEERIKILQAQLVKVKEMAPTSAEKSP